MARAKAEAGAKTTKKPAATKTPAAAKKAVAKPPAKKAVAKRPPARAKPAATKKPAPAISPNFRALVDLFLERPGVTQAQMMGCQGLRVANKFFAMEWDGLLVVKLPRATVDAYVAARQGANFDPGMGRPMKEWLTVAPGHAPRPPPTAQAFTFVAASL